MYCNADEDAKDYDEDDELIENTEEEVEIEVEHFLDDLKEDTGESYTKDFFTDEKLSRLNKEELERLREIVLEEKNETPEYVEEDLEIDQECMGKSALDEMIEGIFEDEGDDGDKPRNPSSGMGSLSYDEPTTIEETEDDYNIDEDTFKKNVEYETAYDDSNGKSELEQMLDDLEENEDSDEDHIKRLKR